MMAGENSDIRVRVGEDASSRYVGRTGAEWQRAARPVQARPCRHAGLGVYDHRDGLVGSSRQAEVACDDVDDLGVNLRVKERQIGRAHV